MNEGIDMRERLEQRLAELQNELAAGQKLQAELDTLIGIASFTSS